MWKAASFLRVHIAGNASATGFGGIRKVPNLLQTDTTSRTSILRVLQALGVQRMLQQLAYGVRTIVKAGTMHALQTH